MSMNGNNFEHVGEFGTASGSKLVNKVPQGLIDPQRLLWLTARDYLLGRNYRKQDLHEALRLAKTSSWPEAIWLVDLVERNGGMPDGPLDAKMMFLKEGNERNDARAIMMAGLIGCKDWVLLPRAAEMGDALAQAYMSYIRREKEKFDWARLSAEQDEPQGLYWLGYCYAGGGGWGVTIDKKMAVTIDKKMAAVYFERAAKLGNIDSYYYYALTFRTDQPEYFLWLGMYSAETTHITHFCDAISKHVNNRNGSSGAVSLDARHLGANSNNENKLTGVQSKMISLDANDNDNSKSAINPVIFQIGKSLIGHIDRSKKRLFKKKPARPESFNHARVAVFMYNEWCRLTREAVDTWIIIAVRYRFPRDMRRLIGEIVWESRSYGLYPLKGSNNNNNQDPSSC